jgi:acyl-[acyl carrier protein]--UDP-N-acetylglucosamine O-acyltransferase
LATRPPNKPDAGYISSLALIGDPAEMRGHEGYGLEPLIHPTARIEAFVSVDAGVERATLIGAHTWLMKHVHIGHDAVLGGECELAPGTVIGGYCEIGHGVKMGVNSCVRPFIKIGDHARIGAGAVVVKDVPPGEVWAGNPARMLRPR